MARPSMSEWRRAWRLVRMSRAASRMGTGFDLAGIADDYGVHVLGAFLARQAACQRVCCDPLELKRLRRAATCGVPSIPLAGAR